MYSKVFSVVALPHPKSKVTKNDILGTFDTEDDAQNYIASIHSDPKLVAQLPDFLSLFIQPFRLKPLALIDPAVLRQAEADADPLPQDIPQ